MNLDQLRAGIERNKKGLAIAGAAGVAGLALMKRNSSGGGSSSSSTTAAAEQASGAGARYGLTPGGGAYDSTASDVYNTIQPQLEALQRLMDKGTAASPIPVTTAPKSKAGFFQVAGRPDLTFLQDENGALDWLTDTEAKAFNVAPGGANTGTIHVVPKDSTFWKDSKFLGSNPLAK